VEGRQAGYVRYKCRGSAAGNVEIILVYDTSGPVLALSPCVSASTPKISNSREPGRTNPPRYLGKSVAISGGGTQRLPIGTIGVR
jgi:hypothetical protein